MAQQLQQQRTSQPSLATLHPMDAVPVELAPCVPLQTQHLSLDLLVSLEQEALSGGADFVGK
jgi:hypothetical protein